MIIFHKIRKVMKPRPDTEMCVYWSVWRSQTSDKTWDHNLICSEELCPFVLVCIFRSAEKHNRNTHTLRVLQGRLLILNLAVVFSWSHSHYQSAGMRDFVFVERQRFQSNHESVCVCFPQVIACSMQEMHTIKSFEVCVCVCVSQGRVTLFVCEILISSFILFFQWNLTAASFLSFIPRVCDEWVCACALCKTKLISNVTFLSVININYSMQMN